MQKRSYSLDDDEHEDIPPPVKNASSLAEVKPSPKGVRRAMLPKSYSAEMFAEIATERLRAKLESEKHQRQNWERKNLSHVIFHDEDVDVAAKKKRDLIIAVTVLSAVLLLFIIGLFLFWKRRKNSKVQEEKKN